MDNEGEFKPFVPPQPMFEDRVTQAAAADKPAAEEKPARPPKADKSPRKKRERNPPKADKPKIPPAPKHERPTRKPRAVAEPPKPKKRKARIVGKSPLLAAPYKKTRALKLDMYAAMAISAALKPTDFKTFESIVETLQSVNKATRRRVMMAVTKVFG